MRFAVEVCKLFRIINSITFIFALCLLGVGLWFRIDPRVYELHKHIEIQNFTIAGWIMLFGGFSACLLTIVGGCAASKRSISLLLFYCVIMTVSTLALIGCLVLTTEHGRGISLERFIREGIYDQIGRRKMSVSFDIDAAKFLDFVQVELHCCGAIDSRDYNKLDMIIPASCYRIPGNFTSMNVPGCAEPLGDMLDRLAGIAAAVTAVSLISNIMAMILGGLILRSVYKSRAGPKSVSNQSTPLGVNGIDRVGRNKSCWPVSGRSSSVNEFS